MAKLDIGVTVIVHDAARPQNGRDVHPAIVTQVHSDDVVSVRVIPEDGVGYPIRSLGRLGSDKATAGLSWRLPGSPTEAGDFAQPEPQPLPTPTGGAHTPQATRGETGLLEDNDTEVNAQGAVHEDAAGNAADQEAAKRGDADEFKDIEGHGAGAEATDKQVEEGKANVAELNGDISTASNAEAAEQNKPGSEAKKAAEDGSSKQSAQAVKDAAKEPDKGTKAKSK